MNDPRAINCRSHQRDRDGKVIAVWVTVHEFPFSKWQCKEVRLINEVEAAGRTIIYNRFETLNQDPVFLCTGYQGVPSDYDDILPDTSGKGELVMTAVFFPPNLGPLAVIVSHQGESDVVASLGLPDGSHVSFDILWGLRDQIMPEPPPDGDCCDELASRLAVVEAKLAVLESSLWGRDLPQG